MIIVANFKQEVTINPKNFLGELLKNMIRHGWVEEITLPHPFDDTTKTVYLLNKEGIYHGEEVVDLELSEEDYKAIKNLEALIEYFNENQSSKLAQRAL